MALYKDPIQAIIDAASAQNGIQLVASQYTFGSPAVLTPAEGLLNSTIELTAIYPTSPYDGAVTVKYHRLPLPDLAILIPLTIKVDGVTSVHGLIPLLNAAHGFNFTVDDLEDTALDLNSGSGTATLTAKVGSLSWIGSVVLNVAPGDYDLTTYVTTKSLAGLVYPTPDLTKPFAYFYSYWRDFSAQQSDLSTVVTGTASLELLKTILVANTGDSWITNATGRYTLLGATVVSNGPTAGNPAYNPDYEFVCVVTLGPNSQGLGGNLYLQYNQPFH